MLSILLNWSYVFITAFCLGQGFSCFAEKKLHYRLKSVDSILVAGLVIATVYAQIFSLFGKVGLTANLVLLAICSLVITLNRQKISEDVARWNKESSVLRKVLIVGLVFVWAYFTSRGYLTYDSDLYHGQSIRWIEEYGVVKGLANLHVRFAYNSASFALSALYSMKFLLGQSLHAMGGFWALVLSIGILDIGKSWKRKKMLLSDFAKVAAIYYLTVICDEIVSPSSDYVVMIVVFFIVIKWLEQLESAQASKNIVPYALLCVCGVYAVTLKLTAGLILILLFKPAKNLLKEKQWKEIGMYLLMGLIIAVPWLARTVIISGWLLYPFPALDLFFVDWKVSAEIARVDAAEIKTWGRALYDPSKVNVPITQWFANWFGTLRTMEKLLILADFVSVIVLLPVTAWTFIKRKKEDADYLLVMAALMGSYLFWQTSAPLIRYGYAYVLLVIALTAGWLLQKIKLQRVVYFALIFYGVYKLGMLAVGVCDTVLQPYYLRQQDYGTYELQTYELNGEKIYYPVSGDQTGYEYFPTAPVKPNIEFRGDGIADGFRAK
ncbi:MAG: hypothetical protein IJX66_05510 [Lachnospiraceae bacterium]|nr:hypothetical protein [Lachnospiraceae bacterium]